jgi:hypothetical protein
MQFSVTLSPADFKKRLKAALGFVKGNEKHALTAAADTAINIILKRTEAGYDVNGSRFARYSKAYAERRQAKGRNVYPVTLSFTGRMLGSMSQKRQGNDAVIYFRGGENNKKAAFNNRTRQFFDLSSRERNRIAAVYFRRLSK